MLSENEGNFLASAFKSVDPKVPKIVYSIEFRYLELTKGKVFMSELSRCTLVKLIKGQNILRNSIKQKEQNDNHNGGRGFSNVDVLSM